MWKEQVVLKVVTAFKLTEEISSPVNIITAHILKIVSELSHWTGSFAKVSAGFHVYFKFNFKVLVCWIILIIRKKMIYHNHFMVVPTLANPERTKHLIFSTLHDFHSKFCITMWWTWMPCWSAFVAHFEALIQWRNQHNTSGTFSN